MPLAMNTNLKNDIEAKIDELANLAYEQKALVLTETDLQCLLYKKLHEIDYLAEVTPTNDNYLTNKIHTEISWFDSNNDNNRKLSIRPDITLLKPDNLKITSGFNIPLPSKGFHSNDGGIIFEIKFDREPRTISQKNIDGIFKDIRNFRRIYRRFSENGLQNEIYAYFIFFIKSTPSDINIIKISQIFEELDIYGLDESKCKFVPKFLEV
jgi:hypothetical protein